MEPHNDPVDLNLVKVEPEQIGNEEMQCEPRLESEVESQSGFSFFEDIIEIKEDPLCTDYVEYDEESVRALIGGDQNGQALIGCGVSENVSLELPTEHIKLEVCTICLHYFLSRSPIHLLKSL